MDLTYTRITLNNHIDMAGREVVQRKGSLVFEEVIENSATHDGVVDSTRSGGVWVACRSEEGNSVSGVAMTDRPNDWDECDECWGNKKDA